MANCIYVHNLFVNSDWKYQFERFSPVFYKPHTGIVAGSIPIAYQNDINYNNIYTIVGTDNIPDYPGFRFDRNVYYQGARKFSYGDKNSIVNPDFIANVVFNSLPEGVEVHFLADRSPRRVISPYIDFDFVGVYEITGQGLEGWKGDRYSVSTDIQGEERSKKHPVAGPLESLNRGKNEIKLVISTTQEEPA